MKKILSVVGALFLGTVAIGQVKTDTANKAGARKVLPTDVKSSSAGNGHPESEIVNQGAKGRSIDIKGKAIDGPQIKTGDIAAPKPAGKGNGK